MQELVRHSRIRVTRDTYTQAITSEKRAAQTAVVSLFVRNNKIGGAARPASEESRSNTQAGIAVGSVEGAVFRT
jgi:hypothetical protein